MADFIIAGLFTAQHPTECRLQLGLCNMPTNTPLIFRSLIDSKIGGIMNEAAQSTTQPAIRMLTGHR